MTKRSLVFTGLVLGAFVLSVAALPGFAKGEEKITICHATASEKNLYVEITISLKGLNGHMNHAADIIPAPIDGCPSELSPI